MRRNPVQPCECTSEHSYTVWQVRYLAWLPLYILENDIHCHFGKWMGINISDQFIGLFVLSNLTIFMLGPVDTITQRVSLQREMEAQFS